MHMQVQQEIRNYRTIGGLLLIFSLLLLPVSLARADSHGEFAAAAEAAVKASDYRTGAEIYRKAYELVLGKDEKLAFQYRLGEADALSQQGYSNSDVNAMKQSIELYKAAVDLASRSKNREGWIRAINGMGTAFRALGEYQSDKASLLGATGSFQTLLKVVERETEPDIWAQAKNDLGLSLWLLGMMEKSTEILAEAVATIEDALTVWTRENAQINWAQTQGNLGLARLALGQQNRDKAMIASARQSVELAWDAFKAAGQNGTDDYFRKLLQEFDAALAQ